MEALAMLYMLSEQRYCSLLALRPSLIWFQPYIDSVILPVAQKTHKLDPVIKAPLHHFHESQHNQEVKAHPLTFQFYASVGLILSQVSTSHY